MSYRASVALYMSQLEPHRPPSHFYFLLGAVSMSFGVTTSNARPLTSRSLTNTNIIS